MSFTYRESIDLPYIWIIYANNRY